jgi:hypothetical protein
MAPARERRAQIPVGRSSQGHGLHQDDDIVAVEPSVPAMIIWIEEICVRVIAARA